MNLLELMIVMAVGAFVLIRPRWRKTGGVLIVLWGVAVLNGLRFFGPGLLLPMVALVMLLKSSGRRQGQGASAAGSPTAAQPPEFAASAEADTHAFDELRLSVLETVKAQLGAADLLYDDEGQLPFRWGSTAVLVRVRPDPLGVEVSSPCLLRIPVTAPLLEAVNDLNGRLPFPGRVFVKNETLIVASGLFGEPFVSGHFSRLCAAVGETADQLDDQLKARFGGTLVSEVEGAEGAERD